MPSTYTTNLGIELPADGELDGVWGDVVNENMDILDRAINGSVALTLSGTTSTLTTSDGALSDGQYKLLVLGGTPSGTHTITIAPNDAQKIYFVRNTTAQSVVFTQGSGGNVTIATGDSAIIYSDGAGAGAAVVNITNDFAMSSVKITGGTIDGTVIGGSSAAAGTFTTAAATTGNITTVNATTVDTTNIEVTTLKAKDGTAAGSIADSTGVVTLASSVLTTADINGGTIDGTTIGGSSAGAGTFTTATATTGNITTVNATTVDTTNIEVTTIKAKDGTSAGSIADSTGVVTLASSVLTTTDINGGTVDGAVIGGASAAAITGTTITATGDVTIADKIVHAGDTNTALRFPAADTVTVETDGAERLRVDSSGRVGIGTSSPAQALSVNGSIDILAATTETRQIQIGQGRTGDGVSVIDFITDATYTDFGLRISRGAGANADSFINARGTGTLNIRTAEAGPLLFSTNATERLRIDASGNLGLGVTPSAWNNYRALQIGPGTSLAGWATDAGTDLSSNAFFQNQWNYIASARALRYQMTTTGEHRWYTAPSGTAGNAITFTQAMTLDASGNLKIGTTSGTGRVIVRAAAAGGADSTVMRLAQENFSTGGASLIKLGTENVTWSKGAIGFVRTGDFDTGALIFAVNSSANTDDVTSANERARITADGDFGLARSDAAGPMVYSSANVPLRFGTNGNERARIDSDGNLLVGTTSSPASFGRTLALSNGGSAGISFEDLSTPRRFAIGTRFGNLVFDDNTAGSERMRIDSSGNVGIGTSSPTQKLQVDGTVLSTATRTNAILDASGGNTATINTVPLRPGVLDPDNRIINGAFDFWQRGTSSTSAGYVAADRWQNSQNGGTVTQSRQAFTLGDTLGTNSPAYFLRQTVSGQSLTNHYALIQQPIEGVRSYAGQTITVLGWARRSSGSGNMAVEVTQNFGTGGSPSSEVLVAGQTVTLTSSFAPFALTFNVPSITGKTLGTNGNDSCTVNFWTSAGSSLNDRTNSLGLQTIGVDLWGVHIKVGTHTTSAVDLYKQPELGPELARCQRFYYRSEEDGFARVGVVPAITTNRESPVFFGVTLRATPSVTISGGTIYRFSGEGLSDGGGTSTTASQITQFGCLQISSGFSTGNIGQMCAMDNWLIQADAEL
jgi:hypothetical protein